MLIDVVRSLLQGQPVDFSQLIAQIIAALAIMFLVLPLHELAHGFVAYKLGDPTAKYSGRLTLNPLAHIDPLGSLGILLFGIGWAKPVPVNPNHFKNRKVGMAITAAAGPISNLLAALVGGVLFYTVLLGFGIHSTSWIAVFLLQFLFWYTYINVALAIFNLIPIPPFDGYRILSVCLPDRILYSIGRYENITMMVVLMILLTGVLSGPLNFLDNAVYRGIMWLAGLPFGLSV